MCDEDNYLERLEKASAGSYTLEQIKAAFWAEFHETGELWFNYQGSPQENNEYTEGYWISFLENLVGEEVVERML